MPRTVGSPEKRPVDPALATLLTTPESPSREAYAGKKVILARKMDRLEFISKARMQFIKILHENNEKKADAITCRGPEKLGEASSHGLVEADKLFENLRDQSVKKKSIPKRLNVIHDYCVHLEMQQSKMAKLEDMDPMPRPELFQDIEFSDLNPTYADLLSNEPTPFKAKEGDVRDPLMAVCLLQPYMPPEPVMEAHRKGKAAAKERIADAKKLEKLRAQKEREKLKNMLDGNAE
ncbi:unnamed protein product [Amoebophrya sp. A25]|nr:unnamed protein product [Amoebophrya sp. A25]|eukprot:GSA25T00018263001.1